MSQVLTQLLADAVPKVQVKSATVVRAPTGLYWILVKPNHYGYWDWFREIYPHWKRVAFTYHARKDSLNSCGFCPEFDVLENLLNWLFDVLGLNCGERKLLLLCVGRRGCHKF